ncbi:hypothetical protein [Kitasatospora sp. Ki12]
MPQNVTVRMDVEVATNNPSGQIVWRACPKIGPGAAGRALFIASWGELVKVLEQTGSMAGRLIPRRSTSGYRVTAHHDIPGGILLGLAEWHRSVETGLWRPALCWTAGEHASYEGRMA